MPGYTPKHTEQRLLCSTHLKSCARLGRYNGQGVQTLDLHKRQVKTLKNRLATNATNLHDDLDLSEQVRQEHVLVFAVVPLGLGADVESGDSDRATMTRNIRPCGGARAVRQNSV